MKTKPIEFPKFRNESQEADWWASKAGRDYLKRKVEEARSDGKKMKGSALLGELAKKKSVQIAIRLPEADLAKARKIADRKGIGYQTLLKMLVRQGLQRENRRS